MPCGCMRLHMQEIEDYEARLEMAMQENVDLARTVDERTKVRQRGWWAWHLHPSTCTHTRVHTAQYKSLACTWRLHWACSPCSLSLWR